MSDEIPNSYYSLKCESCGHGNLQGRMFCYICGNRLHLSPEEQASIDISYLLKILHDYAPHRTSPRLNHLRVKYAGYLIK